MAGDQRQEWTWCDIFRSIGLAFSFSRLMTGLVGLAALAIADGLLVWGAESISASDNEWMQWLGGEVFLYLRLAVGTLVFLLTATAIAYSVKGELLEGEGAGTSESIGFAFRKFGAVFWTPVLFWVYILLMGAFAFVPFVLPALVARLADWTPWFSLSWYAVWYFLVFLFSVLAAMGFLAFLFSFFLSPPIIAVRQEGALDAVLDTIDLMRGKGAFWVSLLVLMASFLVGHVFLGRTFDVGYRVASRAIGEEFALTVAAMPKEIQPPDGTFVKRAQIYWPGGMGAHPRVGARLLASDYLQPVRGRTLETRHKVAGWILGIWVMLLAGFALSFTLGAFVAAATLTYLIIREEEEFLEPVIEGPPKAAATTAPAKEDETAKAEKNDDDEKADEKQAEKKGERKSKRDKHDK